MMGKLRPLVTLAVGIGALVFLGRLLYYQQTHVVASYAFVKGSVVQIGAPVEGQVMEVEVRAGQRVSQGDVLVRLNDTKQRAVVDQANAAWHQAVVQVQVEREAVKVLYEKAGVLSAQLKARMEMNEAAERAAEVDARLASRQADRSTSLRQRDMVSEADHDVTAAANEVAQQRAEQAQGRVSLAEAQMENVGLQQATAKAREARLTLLQAAAATAEAAFETAQADLSLTVIRAPRQGVVSRRLVEPAAAVRVGTPMLEVWYDDDLAVEAWIDESKYGFLSVGAPAETTLPGVDHPPYEGHIAWLGVVTELELKDASFSIPIAKLLAQSHWVRAKVVLDHPDSLLLPGLTTNVSIPRTKAAPEPLPSAAPTPVAAAAPLIPEAKSVPSTAANAAATP